MRRKVAVAVAVSLLAAETVVLARRRGSAIGVSTVVRCRSGHLFTTVWIPGVSLKAVRLGWWRFQRCPVGPHWSFVTPVSVAELSDAERQLAAGIRDVRMP